MILKELGKFWSLTLFGMFWGYFGKFRVHWIWSGNLYGVWEYRYCILYPLRLRPPFPNDVEILRPKVGLGPNQILN